MELGIYTFGDIVPSPHGGGRYSQRERVEQLLEMGRMAEDLGLDLFAVGEHHTPNFVASSPATLLAGVAARTRTIKLTSAVTLISTADPVRTFQEFSSVDLISGGRTEVIFGRGAFTENFPLFGYDLQDYEALFSEKLDLFMRLNEHRQVSWTGRFRPALHEAEPAPRPAHGRLPVWAGALSAPSIVRAARLGLPLALPLLGSAIPHYAQLAQLYRQAWAQFGRDAKECRVAAFSHCFVGETSRSARDEFYPYYSGMFAFLAGRGELPRAMFEQMSAPDGVLMIGSPQEVIDRLMRLHEAVGLNRYLGQMDMGGQPFSQIVKTIERFATQVAPVIRRETEGAKVLQHSEPTANR